MKSMNRIIKMVAALLFAVVLTAVFAAPAFALFEGTIGFVPVIVDKTIYFPAEYEYAYDQFDFNNPIAIMIQSRRDYVKSTNIAIQQQDPNRLSTNDTILIGNDALTVVIVDCGTNKRVHSLNPDDEMDLKERIAISKAVLEKMAVYEENNDLEVFYFTAVPDYNTVEAMQDDRFEFFGYIELDTGGYRVVVAFREKDKAEIKKRMKALDVEWPLEGLGPNWPVSMLGDVDLDGKVTAKDARLALRVSAKLETLTATQLRLADLNSDGIVTAAEARKILRVSAKLESL